MDPKNLVIIMDDEHGTPFLGCAGHPIVKTPNLDRLAAAGTRFSNAQCNNPICMPSRASFATGLYTHETGYWDNVIAYDGRVKGWGHRLQETGHGCVSIGKLHYMNATDPTGIDEQIIPMHVDKGGDLHGLIRDDPPTRHQSKNFAAQIGPGDSEYIRYDNDISARAGAWLRAAAENPADKPWVVFISFIGPHYPMIAPPEFFNLYAPEDIPLPKAKPERSGKLRDWWDAFENCYVFDQYFEDDRQRQIAIAGYFGLISFIDNHIGRIMQVMEETGLMENTRIAFTSDHGENLGTRGLWGKSTMYEESVGVPLIITGEDIPTGKVVETPVSLIDFYPTILRCIGIPPNDQDRERPGRSLLDLAREGDDAERMVLSEYHATASKTGVFMLRNGRYKYIHYVSHGAELFDLEMDPEELRDLSSDPGHQSMIREFEKRLRDILDPEAVDANAKQDQNAVIAELGGRDAVLERDVPISTPAP